MTTAILLHHLSGHHLAALRSLVADLAVAFPERLSAAIRGNLSGEFADLVRREEAAGWRQVKAEAEIRQLAREQQGARGTFLD